MINEGANRVLMVCYAFPPTGGGGVQRSVKFAKYLPQFGWQPTVLTVSNPSVPVQDSDLASEIDPSIKVVRARTLEPSYSAKQRVVASGDSSGMSIKSLARGAAMMMLQPDPQVLWNPFAYQAAKKHLREIPHDAIYVTGPPFSSFLIGQRLKKKFDLPLVVDFRDEWLLAIEYLENHQQGKYSHGRQTAMMGSVLRSADVVVATTQASAAELRRYTEQVGSHAEVRCIYNGYDEDDFSSAQLSTGLSTLTSIKANDGHCETTQTQRLRIVYTGTLWNLTDISPLVQSLLRFASANSNAASKVELVIAGRLSPDQQVLVDRLHQTSIELQCCGYLPHCESVALARSADLLLLLLADQPGAERVVPAKLFEYLAIGKPMLAICGEGETETLLRETGQPTVFHPTDWEGIISFIQFCIDHPPVPKSSANIKQFSRRELTRQLAEVFNEIQS